MIPADLHEVQVGLECLARRKKYLPAGMDVDDAVQDGWVAILEAEDQGYAVGTLVSRIGGWGISDGIRRMSRRRRRTEDSPTPKCIPYSDAVAPEVKKDEWPDRLLEKKELEEALRGSLEELGESSRHIIIEHDLGRTALAVIASERKEPTLTVCSHRFTGLRQLRILLWRKGFTW